MPIEQYNAGRTLREYSQSISNILDMERLASVAIGLIIEAMEIRRGFLFLVDQEVAEDKNKTYRLQAVRSPGEQTIHPGVLSENSPITRYLLANQRPLLQYDLDLLPTLRKGPPEELRWFNQLETEVYVPIFAKREWIGLLALGVKLSGNRYTENDLVTLSALGNQTAVALENARLVDNLVNLNREIRQAYRALDKANRDLERIDRTKSDFISIASHELRTPLTVMRGYAEMLLENPDLDEGVHSLIDGIRKSTIRMHEIMDSMFDIAQLDARNMELSVETVDVAALIQQACDGLKKSVTDREQSLRVILPPLPTVKADPASLKKVFSHLITNAIKFTPNGGKITVHGQMVAANRSDLPEGGIEIVVSDTGIGVDPSLKDVIFTKFYQPGELNKHSTGKTKFKGSGVGLGLALVKGIVDAHGGRIWVESPGHDEENCPGSNFHVILPVRKQGESATVRIASAVKMKL
jgi:signal transduction histidine kinase